MSSPTDSDAYQFGLSPCTGVGVTGTVAELASALEGPVATVLFDDLGKAGVASILTPLVSTEFEQQNISRVLSLPNTIDAWSTAALLLRRNRVLGHSSVPSGNSVAWFIM